MERGTAMGAELAGMAGDVAKIQASANPTKK